MGKELRNHRAEVSSAIGDEEQAAVTLLPEADGMQVRIFESLQLEGSYVENLMKNTFFLIKKKKEHRIRHLERF